jgi:hypothetical protein
MRKKSICFLVLVITASLRIDISQAQDQNKYLTLVRTFADTLLNVGLDKYGTRPSAMWASVIDLEDMTVPQRGVEPTEGVRPHDRAMGGSNYYHDVMTMKVFDALSEVTGDEKYRQSAKEYTQDFLNKCQNPKTGLLGWGEHLFYDFFRDTVSISESKLFGQSYYFGYPHEFLGWTPPWERLWAIDASRTQKAIEGIMWHFQGPDPKTFLFNRHADWNVPEHQTTIMPWIKHTVLFAYSFAFHFVHTGDELWKQRARDIALLYWNNRDYSTDLIFGCLYHASSPDAGKLPSISGTGSFAYWLYKTGELLEDEQLLDIAKKSMLAYRKYGWSEEDNYYVQSVKLNGQPLDNPQKATAWKIGYGSSSLFKFARTAAYVAEKEDNKDFLKIAIECEKQVPDSPLPEQYTALNLGEAINFYLDLYELTGKKYYLDEAGRYAEMGISRFSRNGLLRRQTNDHYYEAKLGIGDLLAGFFRLGMIVSNKEEELKKMDFSF